MSTQEKKSTLIWWVGFLASSALLGWMIYTHNEWLTLSLPLVTTSFVKALDII
jgi:hypothetical protein